MELNITQPKGGAGAAKQVPDAIFAADYNEALIHQVVNAYIHNGHKGTKAQKNRSAVSGGGAKPWRQKGTGRARAGTSRSPIWRKGGVTFAAQPHVSTHKVNRKMYRAALRSILSELVRQDRLVIVEDLKLAEAKTKLLKQQLDDLSLTSVLLVTEAEDQAVLRASGNLYHVGYTTVNGLDPVSLIRYEKVLMTAGCLKQIEDLLA